MLKAEALECLSGLLSALGGWVDDMLGTGEAAAAAAAAKAAKDAARASIASSSGAPAEEVGAGDADGDAAATAVAGPKDEVTGRGLHPSTFQLNLSALYGIGIV